MNASDDRPRASPAPGAFYVVRANCGRVDIIVVAFPAHDLCASGLVIDREALDKFGSYAVWLSPMRIRTVLDADGVRAWTGRIPKEAETP